jgi:hypothetical protein
MSDFAVEEQVKPSAQQLFEMALKDGAIKGSRTMLDVLASLPPEQSSLYSCTRPWSILRSSKGKPTWTQVVKRISSPVSGMPSTLESISVLNRFVIPFRRLLLRCSPSTITQWNSRTKKGAWIGLINIGLHTPDRCVRGRCNLEIPPILGAPVDSR